VLQTYGDNIDVVLASNDMMADGILNVLDSYNIQRPVLITGRDADIVGVHNVYNGKQNMTVYHPAKRYGYGVAELSMDILNGKSLKKWVSGNVYNGNRLIRNYKVKSIKITAENIDKELAEAQECSWEEIKKK
jgi:D-xylose transport system substrate-binding protein